MYLCIIFSTFYDIFAHSAVFIRLKVVSRVCIDHITIIPVENKPNRGFRSCVNDKPALYGLNFRFEDCVIGCHKTLYYLWLLVRHVFHTKL